jgi:hypothetical protein
MSGRASHPAAFHAIEVAEVIVETADAHSLVLAVPDELAEQFA